MRPFVALALPLLLLTVVPATVAAHPGVPCLGHLPPYLLPNACAFHERSGSDCRSGSGSGAAYDRVLLDITQVRGESRCGGEGDGWTHTQQLFVSQYLGAGGYHVVTWGRTESGGERTDYVVVSASTITLVGDQEIAWRDAEDGCTIRQDSRDGWDNSRETTYHACPVAPPDFPGDGWGYMLP